MRPKQSTLSLKSHRRTNSLLEKRPNIALMKWNDFLEKYHTVKQMAMVNASIGIVNSYFREKNNSLTINDVPYAVSEQADTDSRVSSYHEPSNILQQSTNSIHSVFTEQNEEESQLQQLQQEVLELEGKKKEKDTMKISLHFPEENKGDDHDDNDHDDNDEQNFTDEEEEEKNSFAEDCGSKRTISTNKASSVIERWPAWQIELDQTQNLKRTASFLQQSQCGQQNIDRSNSSINTNHIPPQPQSQSQKNPKKGRNRIMTTKVVVLQKLAEQKSRVEHLNIKEDKKYLGQFLKKK